MKKTAALLIILAFSFNSYAQTEKIAHRSHSGKDKTFRITGNDNWGIPSTVNKKPAKPDSVSKNRADSIANKKRADSLQKPTLTRAKRPKPLKKH